MLLFCYKYVKFQFFLTLLWCNVLFITNCVYNSLMILPSQHRISLSLAAFTIAVVLAGVITVQPKEYSLLVSLLTALVIIIIAWLQGPMFGGITGIFGILLIEPYKLLYIMPLVKPPVDPIIWLFLSVCYFLLGILVGIQGSTFRNLEQTNERLSLLQVLNSSINRLFNSSQVKATVLAHISNLMRPDVIQLFELSEDNESFILISARPSLPEQEQRIPIIISAKEGLFKEIVSNGDVVLLSKLNNNLDKLPSTMPNTIISMLAVPLRSASRVGTIMLIGRNNKNYSENDHQLMVSVGDALAVALENSLLFEQAKEQSFSDDLTKLGNRRMFNLRLEMEVDQALVSNSPLCLAIIDLDHFKDVNDKYGHAAGDAVLSQFASRAREQVRTTDLLCRIGGEEFALITPNAPIHIATTVAERIRNCVESYDFTSPDGTVIKITVSIGVGILKSPVLSAHTLMERADGALYASKAAGRNRITIDQQIHDDDKWEIE
jgi:diguanylate cyclase (GGDEF)-like protein